VRAHVSLNGVMHAADRNIARQKTDDHFLANVGSHMLRPIVRHRAIDEQDEIAGAVWFLRIVRHERVEKLLALGDAALSVAIILAGIFAPNLPARMISHIP
jgi:hypothetical protein